MAAWGNYASGGQLQTRPRYRPIGKPLLCESWLYRPFSAGWFMGVMRGSPLIDDWVDQEEGFFGGYRFGWDVDHYWAWEMRFGFGSVELSDSQRAKDAQGPGARSRYDQRRDSNVLLWDVDLLYYPWGDTAWRPYLMAGLGTTRISFEDRFADHWDKTMFAVPLAVGLKYRCSSCLALRFEIADNMAFASGNGIKTQHNLSATAGLEVRFGGSRTAYWPWNPGRHYW